MSKNMSYVLIGAIVVIAVIMGVYALGGITNFNAGNDIAYDIPIDIEHAPADLEDKIHTREAEQYLSKLRDENIAAFRKSGLDHDQINEYLKNDWVVFCDTYWGKWKEEHKDCRECFPDGI